MLTRSLSYYTLTRQQSHAQQQFDLAATEIAAEVAADASALDEPRNNIGIATPTHISSMPRSISLQKLNYLATSSTPFKHPTSHHHNHSIAGFPRSSTKVELVDDERTPPSPTKIASSLGLNELRESATPPSPSTPIGIIHNSTSPEGFLTTEAGSLPLFRTPLVGNALLHPVGDFSSDRLPAALIEDFEIVGRAGEDSTCDTWIVRSKCSGKLSIFKPRDGENFEQRQAFEQRERERTERLRRAQRMAAMNKSTHHTVSVPPYIEPSSSCPHPLSLSTNLRTPLKRGVLYGETTRKEVAAYILDHEHFAGVPKTLEATIFLHKQDAPNGGVNRHNTGVHNYHPYLHGEPHTSQLSLPPGSSSTSPELQSQGRLLLQAASNSPPMSAVGEPLFPFDAEEVWLPSPAATQNGMTHNDILPVERSLVGHSHSHHISSSAPPVYHQHNNNLAPPPNLLSPPSNHSSPNGTAPPSAFHSPEFIGTSSSTPDEFTGLGLSLPSTANDLIATYGSLQEFVDNNDGSAEDIGSSVFSPDEVHRIGILDVRLLNLDRHLGNLLVRRDIEGHPHLVPIDHGFCLPSYQELSDVHLEWTYWKQCQEPFTKETLKYIMRLDPIADAARLRNLGIRDEALVSMVFSSMLLKQAAAAGLNLYSIANMVQREGDGEEPSTLEIIVARVLGSQQSDSSPDPPSTTSSASSTTFDFDLTNSNGSHTQPSDLTTVEEETGSFSPSHSNSNNISRQNSQSTPRNIQSPVFTSPPLTPHTTNSFYVNLHTTTPPPPTPPVAPSHVLLTRSNSDGAMALAEAMANSATGRQLSSNDSVKSTNGDGGEREVKRTRRRSVADAAAQIIALVSTEAIATSTPPENTHSVANANTENIDASSMSTPPPPSMIRLGTELTLHDPHVSGPHSSTDIPTGAKLQHLLIVTESVIREELQSYCTRHGLTPTPPHTPQPTTNGKEPTHSSLPSQPIFKTPTSPKLAPSVSSSTGTTGITTGVNATFNTTLRPPKSPIRSPTTAIRSVDTSLVLPPSPLASMSGLGSSSSLAISLQRSRSRSGSIESTFASHSAVQIAASRMAAAEAHTPPAITAES